MKRILFIFFNLVKNCIKDNSGLLLITTLLLFGYFLYLEKFLEIYTTNLSTHNIILMTAYMTGFIAHIVISLFILKDELLNL